MRVDKLGGLTVRLTGGTDGKGGGNGPLVVLLHGFGPVSKPIERRAKSGTCPAKSRAGLPKRASI